MNNDTITKARDLWISAMRSLNNFLESSDPADIDCQFAKHYYFKDLQARMDEIKRWIDGEIQSEGIGPLADHRIIFWDAPETLLQKEYCEKISELFYLLRQQNIPMNPINNKENCVKAICNFVRVYRSENVRTPIEIYRQTRYSAFHDKITIDDIEVEIRQDPSLIQDWIMFSEDKRWTPAWAFQGNGKSWTVSFIESSGKSSKTISFESGFRACAEMVRNEMEQFRYRTDRFVRL